MSPRPSTAARSGTPPRVRPARPARPGHRESRLIPLGDGSAPHGVIVGPDGAPWVTDGGLNAIVRVDPRTERVDRYPLPPERGSANLNTAAFRGSVLWFTGQAGVLGRLDPKVGRVEVFNAPRGPGPYGITTTPDGQVFYASLAGSHIGRIDHRTGAAEVLEPPTGDQGAVGLVGLARPDLGERVERRPAGPLRPDRWPLAGVEAAGADLMAYAVYVDDNDHPWLSDFAANALVRFDPSTERFTVVPRPARRPTCASCSAGPARCGAPSPAWTSSSWSAPARLAYPVVPAPSRAGLRATHAWPGHPTAPGALGHNDPSDVGRSAVGAREPP